MSKVFTELPGAHRGGIYSQSPSLKINAADSFLLIIVHAGLLLIIFPWIETDVRVYLQCADVHMVSDSEGDDFEDASEFGVDDSEMFGMGSSTCRKSPMSMYNRMRFPIGSPGHG